MTEVAQHQEMARTVPLSALFTALLAVSLFGVGGGGGIVWARRIAVETRGWISDREFADIVSLCQFMPGPNIVGIAVCVGAKMRGTIGTMAALAGFLVIPWSLGLALGLLCLEYAHLPVLRNILGGIVARSNPRCTRRLALSSRLGLPSRRPGLAWAYASAAGAEVPGKSTDDISALLGNATNKVARSRGHTP